MPKRHCGQFGSERAQRLDLRREQASFRNLGDLDRLGIALLRGLAPKNREVRWNWSSREDLAVLVLEFRDLRRVIGGAVLVSTRIDHDEAGLFQDWLEDGAQRI